MKESVRRASLQALIYGRARIRVLRRDAPCLVLGCILSLLMLSACDTPGEEAPSISEGVVHPTQENFPEPDELASSISRMNETEGTSELRSVAQRLAAAEEVFTIGAAEGEAHEMIGVVEDIGVGADGTIFLLDSRNNEVRAYSAEGEFMVAIGGPGEGPGEFSSPEALVVQGSQGRVLVADRQRQVSVFEAGSDALELTSTLSLDLVPDDFCAIEEMLFIRGHRQESNTTIAALPISGGDGQYFGRPYESDNPLVQSQLSDGLIACSEEAQRVVTIFEHLPVLSAYTLEGEEAWVSVLEDFGPIRITEEVDEDGAPAVRFRRPTEPGESNLMSLVEVPGGYAMVQFFEATEGMIEQQNPNLATLRSYLVDLDTGEGTYVGDSLPLVYAVTADRLYAGRMAPFPQVLVYDLPER